MKEFELKYGCNPNQKPAKIYMNDGSELPIKILSGRPGYINFLDAFNSWQLVKESRPGPARGDKFQAREPHVRGSWHPAERGSEESLLCGRHRRPG